MPKRHMSCSEMTHSKMCIDASHSLAGGCLCMSPAAIWGVAVWLLHHSGQQLDYVMCCWSIRMCRCRFYDKAHKMDVLDFFKSQAVDADSLPDAVFAAIGRTVWHVIGMTAFAFRLLMKVMDYNLMALITSRLAPIMPDFKRFQQMDTNKKGS